MKTFVALFGLLAAAAMWQPAHAWGIRRSNSLRSLNTRSRHSLRRTKSLNDLSKKPVCRKQVCLQTVATGEELPVSALFAGGEVMDSIRDVTDYTAPRLDLHQSTLQSLNFLQGELKADVEARAADIAKLSSAKPKIRGLFKRKGKSADASQPLKEALKRTKSVQQALAKTQSVEAFADGLAEHIRAKADTMAEVADGDVTDGSVTRFLGAVFGFDVKKKKKAQSTTWKAQQEIKQGERKTFDWTVHSGWQYQVSMHRNGEVFLVAEQLPPNATVRKTSGSAVFMEIATGRFVAFPYNTPYTLTEGYALLAEGDGIDGIHPFLDGAALMIVSYQQEMLHGFGVVRPDGRGDTCDLSIGQ